MPRERRKPEPKVKTPDQLEAYRRKRDFSRTPEPAPARPVAPDVEPGEARPFVIHRHEARNLHYDLRLEMGGVLVSWAVPRGFSWDPADKHLAVRTEDHPIEYLRFDGVIPRGEYGAGTMVIWDTGTYRAAGVGGPAGLRQGKLELSFDGARLRGEWHMVRTRGERDWLLFKFRDRYARIAADPPFPLDLARIPRAEPAARPVPMRPAADASPFSDPDWVFELAFDGRRAFAEVEGEDVRLLGVDGTPLGALPAAVARDLRRVRAARVRLDGVLVASGEDGRPSRRVLDERMDSGAAEGIVYYAFDLLQYDAWDLRALPLSDRKAALAAILPATAGVLHADHVTARGEELFRVVEAGALPGVVAKRAASPYTEGPSGDWRRIPCSTCPAAAEAGLLESLAASSGPRRSRVRFSNREKVYWPKERITKGRLLDYYDGIADTILPYLRDRPCHMLRYPDGIEGKSFYQKNVTGRIPSWVPTQLVKVEGGEEVRYVVCNDRDTLLFLVNLGSIDLHPWLSRCDATDAPDLAVIDLDPSGSDFAKVVRIAQTVGKMLHGAGLRPCVKTSGATGLHIYVPLVREYGYEQARMFCELVARLTVREHRDIATVERTPSKRGDKVYVDFLQNGRGKLIAAPFSVRPRPGAPVSMPLLWAEVTRRLNPGRIDIRSAFARLGRRGDPLRPVLGPGLDAVRLLEGLALRLEARGSRSRPARRP
jgi:bifunctional non-homologous end joining protein LigD